MKFRSRSFLLLAAVALVFFAGASIYVSAQFGAVDLAGEVLVGERSAAEGVTVHERLLLYTREDGGLFLTVLDAATGSFVQRMRLFTPEETAGRYLGMAASLSGFHSGAGSVFVLRPTAQRDGIAAACAYSDGEYRQLFTAGTRLEAVPDWFPDSADALADADAVDFITDGERMAVLYSVTCSLPELSAGDLYRTHALAVFGSGGAEYAEWLAPVRPETYIFLPPQQDGRRTVWLDEAYRLTLTGRRP